ncbi:MAG: LPP20 family lipoprotein, partial [Calditrichaceae bacterium]
LQLLCIVSCASAPPAKKNVSTSSDFPEWINNPNSLYPDSRYIVGVGSGDTRQAAEKDAVGNIAKVFQSAITVDQTVIENYLEVEENNQSSASFSSQMLNRTSVKSQQDLKNIKIDKVHFSSKDGLYYVLAYLNRAETALLYEQDIKNNDAKIVKYFNNYKSSTNKLNKYGNLAKCKTITAINDVLRSQYQVLTKGQASVPVSIPLSEIDKEMTELLNTITVALYPGKDTPAEVGDYLSEIVGKIGFKMVNTQGDFSMNYSLNIEPTDINRNNLVAYNWKLTIEVRDNVNNYSLKSFNHNKRTTAVSEGEAKSRIMRTIREQLNNKFYKEFTKYLNSI